MQKEILSKIAELFMSDDKEMNELGEAMFFQQNLKQKDINTINEIFFSKTLTTGKPAFFVKHKRGYFAGKFSYDNKYTKTQIEEVINNSSKLVDIF